MFLHRSGRTGVEKQDLRMEVECWMASHPFSVWMRWNWMYLKDS